MLFRRTKRWKQGDYTFLFTPVKRGNPRYAVVVGKKNFKHAVDRNRIRRQIYAQMQEVLAPVQQDFHVICLYNTTKPLQDTSDLQNVLKAFDTFLKTKASSLFSKRPSS